MYYNNQQKQYNNQYSQKKNNQVEIPQFDFNHPTPELFSQTAEDWAKSVMQMPMPILILIPVHKFDDFTMN